MFDNYSPGQDGRDGPGEVVYGGRLDKVPSRRRRLDCVHAHRAPHHAAALKVRGEILDGAPTVPVSVLGLSAMQVRLSNRCLVLHALVEQKEGKISRNHVQPLAVSVQGSTKRWAKGVA